MIAKFTKAKLLVSWLMTISLEKRWMDRERIRKKKEKETESRTDLSS